MKRIRSSEALRAPSSQFNRRHHPLRGRLQISLRGSRWVNIEVPNELWGAASVALNLCARENGTKLVRAASSVAQALAPTFSGGAAPAPEYPQSISDALNFVPKLTLGEDLACLVVSALSCTVVYRYTGPAALSPLYALAMAALCAALLFIARSFLLERHYKAIQRTERELASHDSLFFSTPEGVTLHYKKTLAVQQGSTPAAAIHCFHGFGSSLFSWSFCQRALAQACSALVTSHDMPGFGLSQRPSAQFPYSLAFNGSAGRRILDAELENKMNNSAESANGGAAGAEKIDLAASPRAPAAGAAVTTNGSSSTKKILIGHSMGGAAAAESVIQNPEGVAGLVLVAPAIVALWTGVPEGSRRDVVARGVALTEELVAAEDPPGEVQEHALGREDSMKGGTGVENDGFRNNGNGGKEIKGNGRPLGRVVAALIQAVFSELVRLLILLLRPVLVFFLRRLVRNRSFWERGLAASWSNKSGITPEYVDAYRMGQLVRGWERGILRFMGARFSEKAGLWHAVAAVLEGDGHLSQAERLASACTAAGVKVLIIHGADDVLVPVANSRRLAKVVPGAEFVEIERCGHQPHEECPEQFVAEVERFVKKL